MVLPRDTVTRGFSEEHAEFSKLVRSLDADDWVAPTCCEGWTVGDIAAHVTGTLADVVAGNFDGLGTPEVTQREVDERRDRTPEEIAAELDGHVESAGALLAAFDDDAWAGPVPGNVPGTVGEGVEALWYDAFLHADDIRAATGRVPESGPGLEAAVSHVALILDRNGWGPATLALDGVARYDVGGGGPEITGDAFDFVRAATGRGDGRAFGDVPNIYAG